MRGTLEIPQRVRVSDYFMQSRVQLIPDFAIFFRKCNFFFVIGKFCNGRCIIHFEWPQQGQT